MNFENQSERTTTTSDLISDYERSIQNEDATNILIWVCVIFSAFVFAAPLIGMYAVGVGSVILVIGVVVAIRTKVGQKKHLSE